MTMGISVWSGAFGEAVVGINMLIVYVWLAETSVSPT